MVASVYLIGLFIIGAVFGEDDRPKLRVYHGSLEKYTELPFDEADHITVLPSFNTSQMTTLFCHGFTGHPNGPAVTAVIQAYLDQGQSNVILLNWDRLAAALNNQISSSYLNRAVPNAIKVGAYLADVLLSLSAVGLDLNKTHLVGHSLGAHIVGIAGNKMAGKGVRLPWITGLDPAGVVFDSKRPEERLNPESAAYVDVIHSDPSKYGSRRNLGKVDYWPNFRTVGPVVQPGCDNRPYPRFTPGDLCNHNKCWQYLIDSMKYPGTVIGTFARNYRTWKNYSKQQRLDTVLELGKRHEDYVPGNYYLLTSPSSPYGLGENGL
ncbi:lipase member H-like [Trichoplusia ni]|uniref:Lipase member H-like n=1 Tax=Trichoplusia ni TaxID=7111 RepID=A0A7E5VXN8_TRINI|nr:lipase member H-like [Trichoplusia ni]